VQKGAQVRAGDVVAELSADELTAAVVQARAALAAASANRDHVYAGVRDEEIAGLAAEIAKAICEGWIGGGCARAAVLKAAKDALADGQSRLVSVQPPDALDEQGLKAGEERGGVRFAKNMCPSQGTMDIFVEPVLPRPQVVICGSSPAAERARCRCPACASG
jgi:XdhC and CoxI family